MNLFYPSDKNSTSKACWVLDAISKSTDCERHYSPVISKDTSVIWGLGKYNFQIASACRDQNLPWIFTDMPYWGRWMGGNRDSCYWRVVPGSLHCNWTSDYPDDRFQKLGIKISEWRTKGEHILVCPSSNTVERFYQIEDWTRKIVTEIKKHTDRPIKIRYKPRNKDTSGPRAATIPFEEDCRNAWAVVTSFSIAGVEAACLGIPVFSHPQGPCAVMGNTDLSTIENPLLEDRASWLNTLAYYQYTEEELSKGEYKKVIDDTNLFQ